MVEIKDGKITHDGYIIGTVTQAPDLREAKITTAPPDEASKDLPMASTRPVIELNLGWLRAAGVGIIVHGDNTDRQRSGKVVDRP